MTTTAQTTAAAPILAIDLGKDKSVACVQRSADDHRFPSFATSRAAITRLRAKYQPAVVLIEAGLLAGGVHDLCAAKGVKGLVANTASAAWKFKHLKRKTDRDDALRLAEVQGLGKFPSGAIPEQAVRDKRALIELRQKLVGRRVAIQHRIRSVFGSQGMPAPRGAKAGTETGRAGLATHARPIGACDGNEWWRGRRHLALTELAQVKTLLAQAEKKLDELAKTNAGMQILDTIPGVGPRTAAAVVAFLPEPKRFRTAKQVSAYGGFVPRQYQSTDTDHRGRITTRGPQTLRKLLVECAGVMLRYNAWARAVQQRLTQGGKTRKKQAIVALARQLLVRCWAMRRDGTVWRAEPSPAATTQSPGRATA